MLKIEKVCKRYENVYALNDINIELPETGFVFINGMSGSGKTTLMNLLAGLALPTSGNIYYKEQDMMQYSQKEWAEYRNASVGIVFQSFNLIEDITVKENLLLPLKLQEIKEEEKNRRLQEILEYVGLLGYENYKGNELSAGQKQRIAIARAMIKRPNIILADEATGNLDYVNSESILELFDYISKKCLVVLISHDKIAAEKYGDRIITLSNGELISDNDNRMVKQLSLLPYKVHINNRKKEKCIPIQEFDIRKEVKELANWEGDVLQNCEFTTSIYYDEEIEVNEKTIQWDSEEIHTRRLSFCEMWNFIWYSLKKKRAKNSLIICICAFIAALLVLVQAFMWNNYSEVILRYIQHSNTKLHQVEQCVTTEQAEFEIIRGKAFYQKLKSCIGEKNILKVVEQSYLRTKDNDIVVDKIIYNDNIFSNVKFEGERPNGKDEVAIHQKVAESMEIQIGDKIWIEDIQYIVTGIFDMNLGENENVITMQEQASNRYLYELDNMNLQACDVTKSVDLDEYVQSIQTIGNVSDISEQALLWGRLPKNKGDIVISSELAVDIGYSEKETIIKKYRLRDLYEEKYSGEYTEYMNLYDYLGKKVNIVGIYDMNKVTKDCGNILVPQDLYCQIVSDYAQYLNYTCCYVNLENCDKKTMGSLLFNDFCLNNDVCEFAFLARNFAGQMKLVVIMASFVLLIMVIFVIVAFMSYYIREEGKRIGIYKSMGVSDEDLRKMFVFQNLFLNGIAVVLANTISYFAIKALNKKILFMSSFDSFQLFMLNGFVVFSVNMVILAITVVATIAPLSWMLRSESISLINENDI